MKKLYIVGLGPGNQSDITSRALDAISKSDVVAGYKTYIDLISSLLDGKTVISSGMMTEIERCKKALESAASGRTTSLVCSGDSGVFALASPVLELSPSFADVEIEIVPGITAAISSSAILGSPLAHDFAVISLSDALTPRAVILQRLLLCARAGLCIALYNPMSKNRPDALKNAVSALLTELSEDTVCAYARNVGREGEEWRICTLLALEEMELDMFCTVFIGNKSTKIVETKNRKYIVTPRGYEKKYEL